MTIEGMMERIRASLTYYGGAIAAEVIAREAGDDITHPSPTYRGALERLIAAREIEEYIEDSADSTFWGEIDDTKRTPFSALRFSNKTPNRTTDRDGFRARLDIDECLPVTEIFLEEVVNAAARNRAAYSTYFKPPTIESGWWWVNDGYWWLGISDIPVTEIVAELWSGPVHLRFRITRWDPTDEEEDGEDEEDFKPPSRMGGLFQVAFDYTRIPEEDLLVLVGRVPDELVGPSPFDGVYICLSVRTTDEFFVWKFERTVDEQPTRESSEGMVNPIESAVHGGYENGEDTAEEPYIYVAGGPADLAGQNLVLMALKQADIPCQMYSLHGSWIHVPASRQADAIHVIREDAWRHGYRVLFPNDDTVKRFEALSNYRDVIDFVKNRAEPVADREEKLLAMLTTLAGLRPRMSAAEYDSQLLMFAGPALVCWWRDRPASIGRLDDYLTSSLYNE
jgi:hypothetical protein